MLANKGLITQLFLSSAQDPCHKGGPAPSVRQPEESKLQKQANCLTLDRTENNLYLTSG